MSEKNNKYVLGTYCCPRVNPYYFNDGSLVLPCYDEGIERGVLFHFGKGRLMERYVCMNDFPAIQPSLVHKNGKFYVFFRNFQRNLSYNPSECYAPYAELTFSTARQLVVFGSMKKSGVPNHNESIATFNDREGNALILYNAQKNRKELTLGMLEPDKQGMLVTEPLIVLNETTKASYPNCCFNNKNQLVVSYTAYEKGINHGSAICLTTVSSKYGKVLSRKYITPETLGGIK